MVRLLPLVILAWVCAAVDFANAPEWTGLSSIAALTLVIGSAFAPSRGAALILAIIGGTPLAATTLHVVASPIPTGNSIVVTTVNVFVLAATCAGVQWMTAPDGLFRRRRRNTLRCGKCGYDLAGLTMPYCPECGSSISPQDFARIQHEWAELDAIAAHLASADENDAARSDSAAGQLACDVKALKESDETSQ